MAPVNAAIEGLDDHLLCLCLSQRGTRVTYHPHKTQAEVQTWVRMSQLRWDKVTVSRRWSSQSTPLQYLLFEEVPDLDDGSSPDRSELKIALTWVQKVSPAARNGRLSKCNQRMQEPEATEQLWEERLGETTGIEGSVLVGGRRRLNKVPSVLGKACLKVVSWQSPPWKSRQVWVLECGAIRGTGRGLWGRMSFALSWWPLQRNLSRGDCFLTGSGNLK